MMALHAQHRWCLSGTPLQNRVGELYSLVAFLRLEPHAYYFCKKPGCNCKCREYRFDADYRTCEYCGHTPLQHWGHSAPKASKTTTAQMSLRTPSPRTRLATSGSQ